MCIEIVYMKEVISKKWRKTGLFNTIKWKTEFSGEGEGIVLNNFKTDYNFQCILKAIIIPGDNSSSIRSGILCFFFPAMFIDVPVITRKYQAHGWYLANIY